MRTCAVVILLTLLPGIARAEPPVPAPLTPIPPGPDVITPLTKGQQAPHDGQLFDQATSLRWANFLQQCNARLRLDVTYQYKMDQADLVLAQTQLAAERDQYLVVTEDLRKRLTTAQEEAASPPFYRTVWFGVVVGVVATVGVVAGTAALVNAAK